MPNPENESTPYLKGMLTLSILMLIYVYGQADIKSTLTIALVGLEIRNPDILGQIIFIALTWYTIRFWRKSNQGKVGMENGYWDFIICTRGTVNDYLKQERYIDILTPKAHRAIGIDLRDDSVAKPKISFSLRLKGRFIRDIDFTPSFTNRLPSNNYSSDVTHIKMGWMLWFRIYIEAVLEWIFDHDSFSSRYLPFFIAIFSLMSSLTLTGWNPTSYIIGWVF